MSEIQPTTENADEIQNNDKPWLFKKGQSGNPAGKPKGLKNFGTLLKEILREIDPVTKKPKHTMMLEELVKQALDGNIKATSEIMDRVDGKPTQAIDMNNLTPIPDKITYEVVVTQYGNDDDTTDAGSDTPESPSNEDIQG